MLRKWQNLENMEAPAKLFYHLPIDNIPLQWRKQTQRYFNDIERACKTKSDSGKCCCVLCLRTCFYAFFYHECCVVVAFVFNMWYAYLIFYGAQLAPRGNLQKSFFIINVLRAGMHFNWWKRPRFRPGPLSLNAPYHFWNWIIIWFNQFHYEIIQSYSILNDALWLELVDSPLLHTKK